MTDVRGPGGGAGQSLGEDTHVLQTFGALQWGGVVTLPICGRLQGSLTDVTCVSPHPEQQPDARGDIAVLPIPSLK